MVSWKWRVLALFVVCCLLSTEAGRRRHRRRHRRQHHQQPHHYDGQLQSDTRYDRRYNRVDVRDSTTTTAKPDTQLADGM